MNNIGLEIAFVSNQAIDKIIDNVENGRDPMLPEEYINVYTVCYIMCTQRRPHNYSSELYSRHNDVVTNYLSDTVLLPSMKRDVLDEPDEFMRQVLNQRKKFEVINTSLKKVFTYLEQYYTKYYSLVCLYVSGLTSYKRIVYDAMKTDVLSAVLTLVDRYRYGAFDDDDSDLIASSIRYINAAGTNNPADPFDKSAPCTSFPCSAASETDYFDEFEPRLLTNTIQHYQSVSLSWNTSCYEVSEYLIQAELALHAEAKFAKDFLHEKSAHKLMEAVRQTLLKSHQMESQCRLFLQHDQFDMIRRAVALFQSLENGHGLKYLADVFQGYLAEIGTTLWNDFPDNEKSFVLQLSRLHVKHLALVSDVFDNKPLFQEAQQQAFTNILNLNVGRYSGIVFLREFSPPIKDGMYVEC